MENAERRFSVIFEANFIFVLVDYASKFNIAGWWILMLEKK